MMFSEHLSDTARFPKEELKEEVEEEKDIDQAYGEERSSHHSNNNTNSESDGEITEQEEPNREIEMAVDDRITPRTYAENRGIYENSINTHAEMNSSVENLSHTMPHIQIPNEYQQNHNTVNERRLFNHLIGTGSDESSDYEEIENQRITFVMLLKNEKQQIEATKKELRKYKSEFERRKKQEWDRINLKREICKENTKRIMKLQDDSNDIIELDIGGTHKVTTTRNTLCKYKYSGLAAMFSGRHAMQYNKDQVCFMDRDGEPFCKLISFLRTGQLPVISDKKQEHLFREEMIYWQIPFDGNEEEEKGVSIFTSV